MKTLAVLDADIPLYQTCTAVEHPVDWGGDIWTLHADLKEARELLDNTIEEIRATVSADKIVLCLTGPINWRHRLMPEYKANRTSTRKPVVYAPLKEYVLRTYDCMLEPELEADDCVALVATGPRSRWRGCGEVVMISEDKDFKSVPGTLYNPRTGDVVKTTVEQADQFHLYQTLVGDAVDNYKGCPGVGPVSAQKLLDASPNWESVVGAYEKAGLTEQDALVQARVARILRHREYNIRKKEVRLWVPTSGSGSKTQATGRSSTRAVAGTREKAKVATI